MKKSIVNKKISSVDFSIVHSNSEKEIYKLQLYVAGSTPKSINAVANIKNICEEHLPGRYQLEVFDLYQFPELASGEQIIAVPILIKAHPLPKCRIIGDMSDTDRVLVCLGIENISNKRYNLYNNQAI